MKIAFALALAALSSHAAAQAAAAPPAPSGTTYLSFRLGTYQPQDDEDMAFFDDGLDFEGTAGFTLNRNVALEVAVGYYRSSTGQITMFIPELGTTVSSRLDLAVVPITGSIRLTARAERFTFSGLAGVGVHLATMDGEASAPGFGSFSDTDDDPAFGVHLGGAIAFEASPRVSLGLEIRRTFVEATLLDSTGSIDGLRLGGTLTFRP